jgi:hypothetical protein
MALPRDNIIAASDQKIEATRLVGLRDVIMIITMI